MIVADASTLVAALLPDERTPAALDVLRRAALDEAAVPAHWPLEIASALFRAERRRRIDRAFRDVAITRLLALPVRIVPVSTVAVRESICLLADKHRLSVYDAAYLQLALVLAAPLATADRTLAAAAEAEGIGLVA